MSKTTKIIIAIFATAFAGGFVYGLTHVDELQLTK